MVTIWPRITTCRRAAVFAVLAVHDLLDIGRHRAQVAVLGGGVEIGGGQHVVLRDHGGRAGAREGAQRAQHLRRGAAGRRDGQIVQRLERVQLVFRRLRDDAVGDVGLGIEEEIRRGLAGAGQRGRQRVGDVFLRAGPTARRAPGPR